MKIKVILFSLLLSGALLVYVFAVYAQQTGNSQKMNIQIGKNFMNRLEI